MSTTSLTIAVVCYVLITIVLVWWLVYEAREANDKVESLYGRVSKAYRRINELEIDVDCKRDTIKRLFLQLQQEQDASVALQRQLDDRPAELDTEPPAGSIVAVNGSTPWIRNGLDGAPWASWSLEEPDLSWAELWTSDLRVLRWGWEQ